MRRRAFIAGLGGAVAWPMAVRAQRPSMPVVGYLSSLSRETDRTIVRAVQQGLTENGFVEGKNVTIEYRWADGRFDRLPELAADLVRRKVEVIVTGGGTPDAFAAKSATTAIPIVFGVGTNPVEVGLVVQNLPVIVVLNIEVIGELHGQVQIEEHEKLAPAFQPGRNIESVKTRHAGAQKRAIFPQ